MKSKTNELTGKILKHLFDNGIFAFREDDVGIPVGNGRFKPAGKTGKPDIFAILPPVGTFLGIEVKTAKDKLSPVQQGFIASCAFVGARVLVVKTWEDYLQQFDNMV